MDSLRNYDIEFSGLKNGKHEFKFEADQAFFNLFGTEQEFCNPKITADVILDKHSTFLELMMHIHGSISLECDITGKNFDYPVDSERKVLIKFGEEYDDSNEEVVTIPQTDHAYNVAQLIYEEVMLSVPMKKISPEVSEDDLDLLDKYSPKEQNEEEETTETDPRWEALKKLKDKN